MANRSLRSSPLAVVLLTLLAEAPMHAYRMQQLIEERHKDQIVNVAQRNSIYQTIERLRRAELLAVRETVRDERRPERTIYHITEQGTATLRQWLRTMLAAPAREFPEFPAALACLPMLSPEDVLRQLEARVVGLEEALAQVDPQAAANAIGLPRLFLIEDEYRHAAMSAELRWVRSLIEDVRSGALTWNDEWLHGLRTSRGISSPAGVARLSRAPGVAQTKRESYFDARPLCPGRRNRPPDRRLAPEYACCGGASSHSANGKDRRCKTG